MAQIGPYAEQLFFLILKENKGYWTQPVRGILSLSKKYPDSIVNLACKRALCFGAHNYQIVKRILEAGTHVLPVDFAQGVIQ